MVKIVDNNNSGSDISIKCEVSRLPLKGKDVRLILYSDGVTSLVSGTSLTSYDGHSIITNPIEGRDFIF